MTVRMTYKDMPPEIYSSMLHVEKTVNNSGLNKRILHLIKIRASQINGCAFCIDMHVKEAKATGMSDQDIYGLYSWKETPYYSESERAVLLWVEALTLLSENQVPDALFELISRHFDRPTIGKLTLAAIAINSWNRMILAIGTEPGSYKLSKL